MPVLDTSFLIDLMRGDEGAILLLEDLLTDYDPILVSAVTVMELFHGVARSRSPALEERRIRRVLRGISTVSLDFEAARYAGLLDGRLANDGIRASVADLLIAAAALQANDVIVTRDADAFERIEDVSVTSY